MSFLSSPADDMPETCSRADMHAERLLATLRHRRQTLINALDEVERMLQGQAAGDPSFTGPGCQLTVALALNRLDDQAKMLRDVHSPQPLPVSKPFGRRPVPDSRPASPANGIRTGIPEVASFGGLS